MTTDEGRELVVPVVGSGGTTVVRTLVTESELTHGVTRAWLTLAALGLAYVASLILNREQEPAYEAFVGSGARVGDPGHNLVGPNWNGLNRERPSS